MTTATTTTTTTTTTITVTSTPEPTSVTTTYDLTAETHLQTGRINIYSSPAPATDYQQLSSAYEIFSYEGGNCFVETNVLYASLTPHDDDFAQYYAHSLDKCCSDCNRLAICLSWSFSLVNQTCTLKRGFRSSPTLARDYVSGFKPFELFSLSIARGLEFVNLDTDVRLDRYALSQINVPGSTTSIALQNDLQDQVIF